MEIKEKVLTVKLPDESHRRLKVLASSEGLSIKKFLMNIVNDIYTRKFKSEDKEWNSLMKYLENAPEEEPDEIDLEIMKRAKIEKAKGEIEDYEDDLKEPDDESSDN